MILRFVVFACLLLRAAGRNEVPDCTGLDCTTCENSKEKTIIGNFDCLYCIDNTCTRVCLIQKSCGDSPTPAQTPSVSCLVWLVFSCLSFCGHSACALLAHARAHVAVLACDRSPARAHVRHCVQSALCTGARWLASRLARAVHSDSRLERRISRAC